MKVIAYSIQPSEKEFLVRANQKKHEITLISNPLSAETAAFAQGKDAVVISSIDDASGPVIEMLADLGVKYIATRSVSITNVDRDAAANRGIKLANAPAHSPKAIDENTIALAHTISNLDMWQEQKCVGGNCACKKNCHDPVALQATPQNRNIPLL